MTKFLVPWFRKGRHEMATRARANLATVVCWSF